MTILPSTWHGFSIFKRWHPPPMTVIEPLRAIHLSLVGKCLTLITPPNAVVREQFKFRYHVLSIACEVVWLLPHLPAGICPVLVHDGLRLRRQSPVASTRPTSIAVWSAGLPYSGVRFELVVCSIASDINARRWPILLRSASQTKGSLYISSALCFRSHFFPFVKNTHFLYLMFLSTSYLKGKEPYLELFWHSADFPLMFSQTYSWNCAGLSLGKSPAVS